MVLFSQTHVYQHPWGDVTLAFWRKYPNRMAPHVRAVDTYHVEVNPEGDMVTHRVIMCKSNIPSWMVSLGVSPTQYGVEQTVTSVREKRMVVRSRNITGSSIMCVEEKCTYTQHPENPKWTRYESEANIKAFLPLVWNRLESYTHSSFQANSSKGLAVIEGLCAKFAEHRVTANGFAGVDVSQFLLSLARM